MAWLLTWLWQGVAIALVVSLLLRTARRLNASTQHVIWWTTLVVVLALPVVTAIGGGAVAPAPPFAGGPSATGAPLVVTCRSRWAPVFTGDGWVACPRGARRAPFLHLRQLSGGGHPVEQERGLMG
jgi:hypothetical protein